MSLSCPVSSCFQANIQSRGVYLRKVDGRAVRRFKCQSCGKCFSEQTFSPSYRLRRLDLFESLRSRLMCSSSQRRAALMLKATARTIARFIPILARIDGAWQERFLAKLGPVETIVFDEMMSYEHTRLKPLSLPIAVCERTQAILVMGVAQIPASGLLAEKSLKKYGFREDHSHMVRSSLLESLAKTSGDAGSLKSDAHQSYGEEVKQAFPKRFHEVFLSRRGCVVGYGELKRTGFDPIFMINHACAMVRDSIARLKRRTWCTTKKPERLQHLLAIYIRFHNEVLLPVRKGVNARSRAIPAVV